MTRRASAAVRGTVGIIVGLLVSGQVAGAQEAGGYGRSWTVAAAPMVSFLPLNAHVVVVGAETDSILIEAAGLGPITLEHERSGPVLQVNERRPAVGAETVPRYRLTMPTRTRLLLTVQSGSATVEGITGELTVRVTEGPIHATSVSGALVLSAVLGNVLLERTGGNIDVRSVTGDVTIRDVGGSVEARSTSGSVAIAGRTPLVVDAESYSGEISFAGALEAGAPSSFVTHSGAILLEFAQGSSPTLFVRSVEGDARTTCGRNAAVSPDAPFVLGDGSGPSVRVLSFTGRIRIGCGR